jgi:hypothetical protein
MKKKRFSCGADREGAGTCKVGVPVVEVIRRAGIREQTFHRWKVEYVGLEVDQVGPINHTSVQFDDTLAPCAETDHWKTRTIIRASKRKLMEIPIWSLLYGFSCLRTPDQSGR